MLETAPSSSDQKWKVPSCCGVGVLGSALRVGGVLSMVMVVCVGCGFMVCVLFVSVLMS